MTTPTLITAATEDIDHKTERDRDTAFILNSAHPRRVIVAGPGTGKSFLFQEAIKKDRNNGKTNFLALTFMGKLCDELADELAGQAETKTLHSFARGFVLEHLPDGWEYCPEIYRIIKEDLELKGITEFEIGDSNYRERTEFYRAVGDDDVVHYAVEVCKKDASKIPSYDLVLVDEYQDLNEKEAELIDSLASVNRMMVVGDDDQALYAFKGSYSKFIREKFDQSNDFFESHVLKYCSRCPEVIVKTFNDVVGAFGLNNGKGDRINKEYVCFTPDKAKDSSQNPKLLVMKDVPDGMLAFKIQKELEDILKTQKIKSVLVIGEGQSCQSSLSLVARLLSESGLKQVNHKNIWNEAYSLNQRLILGYKILSKNKNPILAWRLIIDNVAEGVNKKVILKNLDDKEAFIKAIPSELAALATANAKVLARITGKPKSNRDAIANASIEKLEEAIKLSRKEYREILIDQLVRNSNHPPRPLVNLDINVCSILGAKGLGADIVFLIGFDQGRLPATSTIKESEIYQLLVALTRAKKRIYIINTMNKPMSSFLEYVGNDNYQYVA